ncbi:MAG: hypothetical protein OXI20_14600 [Rhodospirillales bacterium]|nr:hypothetical protein [Rhodospirillales bacterium]
MTDPEPETPPEERDPQPEPQPDPEPERPTPEPEPEFRDEAMRLLGPADTVIRAQAGPCGDDSTCLAFVLGGLIETAPARDDLALSELDIDRLAYQPAESRGGVPLAKGRRGTLNDTFSSVGYGGWLEHNFFYVHLSAITARDVTVSRSWFPNAYSVGDATGTNPAPVAGGATWAGAMVGIDISDSPSLGNAISGDAEIRIADLTNPRVDVSFTGIRDEDVDAIRPAMMWSDLAVTDGEFNGLRLRGQFYGPNHEEVGGVFSRDDILGAFGAVRE